MGNIVTAVDGLTSIPSTKTLTSAQDFIAAGVRKSDVVHLVTDPDGGDNGKYYVDSVAQFTLTVNKEWSTGSLTDQSFRVQQIEEQFVGNADYTNMVRMDKDAHRHVLNPTKWWVIDQGTALQRNIYGEPIIKTQASASDGVTSIPGTRSLYSISQDFEALGVQPADLLTITGSSDAGPYKVVTVSSNLIIVDEDWPVGSLTGLTFTIQNVYHVYTELSNFIPVYIRLNPTRDELEKYGLDEKRDCIFTISKGVCDDLSFTPKIGDRFDIYSEGRIQQFEVLSLNSHDVDGNFEQPLHYVGTANKSRSVWT